MKTEFNINYQTKWGESLVLIIDDVKTPMDWIGDGNWRCIAEVPESGQFMYIYNIVENGLMKRTEWSHHVSRERKNVIQDYWIDCPVDGCPFNMEHRNKLFDTPGFRGAGTAVPVFALRSNTDFGIGEFHALKYLVDWASATGQCIIQLLPINDTTRNGSWDDSYPYNPVSPFALNPMYIHLQDLYDFGNDNEFNTVQQRLNKLDEIDYPEIYREKMKFIKIAFEAKWDSDSKELEYRTFCSNNLFWLDKYAQYAAKRDNTTCEFQKWVQFHLDKQLSEVVKYARAHEVCFKGDLPIGISADSVTAYNFPEILNLDSTAGAPPDYFSKDGQNWGFPTYNWEEMEKDGYKWWKIRLRHMSQYFDAFRIDHILGFFRIWEIPKEYKSGMEGHFNPALPYTKEEIEKAGLPIEGLFHEDPRNKGKYQPYITANTDSLQQWQKNRFSEMYNDFFYRRHEEFWRINAEKKLPELLYSTGMLACGEDLGMVPGCVPGVMWHHKILSLKIRGMENEGEWKYLSVAATSSHDMPTLRMQMQDDPSSVQIKEILDRFLQSPSMLAIFPIQDWMALDDKIRRTDRNEERINEPANPNHHWRFRMHIPVEELLSSKTAKMNDAILELINRSRRAL